MSAIAEAPRSAVVDYDAFVASKLDVELPTGIPEAEIPELPAFLKPFQSHVTRWGLLRGRCALFEDTGLGKTIQEIVWGSIVSAYTGKPVLILTPLAVAQQFVSEGEKFGVSVRHVHYQREVDGPGVYVSNYERLHHFDSEAFGGLVIDESSILANFDGKTRRALNEFGSAIPFRMAASATPAPNDLTEIINHAEFLGVMGEKEVKALFFTQDGNNSNQWRLKGHAKRDYWRWMASWSVALRKPSDLGFSDEGYDLPPLEIHEHVVSPPLPDGQWFVDVARTLTERRNARRDSMAERVEKAAALVAAEPDEAWIVWCGLNAESEALTRAIPGAVEVKGSDSEAHKEWALGAFARGEIRVIVTKASIAGMGLNWQHSARAVYVGLSDSFREFYQSLRRQWRFGQQRAVHAHLVISEAEGAVLQNVRRKEREHGDMMASLVAAMSEFSIGIQRQTRNIMEYQEDVVRGEGWDAYMGDSVKWTARADEFPDDSVGLWIFSPPFPGMYAYTNSPHDMGNVRSMGEMVDQFRFLIPSLYRTAMPGRSCVIHLTQGVAFMGTDGYSGLKDFRGELIRAMEDYGWRYYGEVTIDKNPQLKAMRTKDAGLQFKSLANDSARMHVAMADMLLQFRKPGDNPHPIRAAANHPGIPNPDGWITQDEWIRWARPVWYASDWMPKEAVLVQELEDGSYGVTYEHADPAWLDGIRETDVLNVRQARDTDDERHLCPLQIGVVERCVKLWSNPGEVVATPFGGIGTEGYVARRLGRSAKLVELKGSYFKSLLQNVRSAHPQGKNSGYVDLMAL
jgi:hypothetical protein